MAGQAEITVIKVGEVDPRAVVEKACTKLNWVMLPFLLLFSIIASIDRANLGFASIDLSKEIGLTAEDYGLGVGLFFLSYSMFQVSCFNCLPLLQCCLCIATVAVPTRNR